MGKPAYSPARIPLRKGDRYSPLILRFYTVEMALINSLASMQNPQPWILPSATVILAGISAVLLTACTPALPASNSHESSLQSSSSSFSSELAIVTQSSSSDAPCPPYNSEPANTSVHYENHDYGIAFDIPYNPSWGYEGATFSPYEPLQKGDGDLLAYLSFGRPTHQLGPLPTCDLTHGLALRIIPQRSAKEAIAQLTSASDRDVRENPVLFKQNGLSMLKYVTAGMCDSADIEIIGRNYNYVFESYCMFTAQDWIHMEMAAQSVKLLP